MEGAAALLDPAHGNFTRHLTYIRLVGAPGADFMAGQLERIARNHDFKGDFFSKRARTIFTLAALTSSDHPVVSEFRRALPKRLGSFLDRSDALSDTLVLGPYACSPAVIAELRAVTEKPDESDREKAARALKFCRTP